MDPLNPFVSIIRSLWEHRSRGVDGAQSAGGARAVAEHKKPPQAAPIPTIQTLDSRLRARMAALSSWDARRARAVFVECVLTSEFGDDLATDPAFMAMIQRVNEQLASDAKLSARLDQLLERVAAGEAAV